jgi:predicted GH43/DUF377 family glycosyl hydrolase
MFNKKYVLEGSLMNIGTKKLPEGKILNPHRLWEWHGSFPKKVFMDNVSVINHLKIAGFLRHFKK